MQEQTQTLAGLHTIAIGPPSPGQKTRALSPGQKIIVLLHGYDMAPADLAPFAHSMKVPALFLLPRGPLETPSGNRAWWHIDTEAKARALLSGPRDLADEYPPGVPAARQKLKAFLDAAIAQFQPRHLVIGGFSQGGMLACDFALEEESIRIDGLFLLSSSRIRLREWEARRKRLAGLSILISHGKRDDDLAFSAGERLKDFASSAGAQVTWIPADSGHQIPLIVWRELRKFLNALLKCDPHIKPYHDKVSTMTSNPSKAGELLPLVQTIATEIAAAHAADVDAKARFPRETVDALKKAKVLSAAVPRELGGAGYNMRQLAALCSTLAQACGSSGMVLAMHYIQVACIARHAKDSPFFRRYLQDLVEHQYLLASMTSENGTFGETRMSICAVERKDGRFTLNKDATTGSYCEHADGILVTCRRAPDAPGSDQVLVLVRQDEGNSDYKLTQTTSWDTMGMRGTCSPGFKLESSGPEEQIVPGSFADSSAQTMVPYSHILWASLWWGIAADAVARAAEFVRGGARKNPGTVPPTATRLAEVATQLQAMRHNWLALATEFDEIDARPGGMQELLSIGWALKMNNLKINASETAPQIVHKALQITGILGYKNDSKFSLSRHYRDSLSGALMISNDRIASKSASMLLVFKDQ